MRRPDVAGARRPKNRRKVAPDAAAAVRAARQPAAPLVAEQPVVEPLAVRQLVAVVRPQVPVRQVLRAVAQADAEAADRPRHLVLPMRRS